MVEGNRGHHLSVVPYLKKILIWGLRGIKCQKSGFLTFSRKRYFKFFWFLHVDRGQHYATSCPGFNCITGWTSTLLEYLLWYPTLKIYPTYFLSKCPSLTYTMILEKPSNPPQQGSRNLWVYVVGLVKEDQIFDLLPKGYFETFMKLFITFVNEMSLNPVLSGHRS